MSTVQFQSYDGEVFVVDKKIANCFGTIRMMLDCDNVQNTVIPLPNVNAAILHKVLQWADFHKDDPVPSEREDENLQRRTDDICLRDADFVKVNPETLCELLMAANYLDARGLIDLICKAIANTVIVESVQEICRIFDFEK